LVAHWLSQGHQQQGLEQHHQWLKQHIDRRRDLPRPGQQTNGTDRHAQQQHRSHQQPAEALNQMETGGGEAAH
jgi:hypothetical protein